jgi:hypothetical protein
LSVIVLNYGTPELAIAAARSALADLEAIEGGVVLVDNASPDDSVARLTAWRATLAETAPIRIVRSPGNLGYAGGNNVGIKTSAADFYVLLNSDTLVKKGTFGAMLAGMDADPKLGILGPKIVDETGREQVSRFRRHSPLGEFVEATGTDIFYRLFRSAVVPIFPGEAAAHDWIGFPCVMLRGRMVDDIGLLDEGYFLYFEDGDYCRRAAKAGWRIGHTAKGEVAHFIGGSSKIEEKRLAGKRLPAYYYASRTRYFRKWYGGAGYVAANLLWYLGRAASLLRILTLKAPTRTIEGRARDIWTPETAGRPVGAEREAKTR